MSEPGTFRCTPAGQVARSRGRLRRLLLGLAGLMLVLAVGMFVVGRWGPGVICLGAMGLAWLAWRMSGDLDPLWLTVRRGELAVQMRRQRASLDLRDVSARRLGVEEVEQLRALTSASGVTFATASYESAEMGSFDLYATDLANAVRIEVEAPPDDEERDRDCWIVTPDQVDEFLAAIESAALPAVAS
jgi:hypothetical protein